jgi:hypothetical protein
VLHTPLHAFSLQQYFHYEASKSIPGKGMNTQERKKELFEALFKRYGSLMLSRKEVATIIGVSTATLDRLKKDGNGPPYKKRKTHGPNGSVFYPIDAVVDFVVSNNIKTL